MTTDPGQSARSREHILVAVAALLQEQGASAITFQNVAEAAGVGRATMYRHWTDPAALMRDALGHISIPFLDGPARPIHVWLRDDLKRIDDELAEPLARSLLLTVLSEAQHDPGMREIRDRLAARAVRRLSSAFTRAVTAGELSTRPDDVSAMFDRLVGPVVASRILRGRATSAVRIAHLVDDALAPLAPLATRPGPAISPASVSSRRSVRSR